MAVVLSGKERNCFSSPTSLSNSENASGLKPIILSIDSPLSSAPSPPRTLLADSTTSSFSNSLSLNASWEGQADKVQIIPLSHNDVEWHGQVRDLQPLTNALLGNPNTASPISNSTSSKVLRLESLGPAEYVEDDTAVRIQPSMNVDYLSHNWKKEDIWASWRYIVSERQACSNTTRLENALWRTWAKSKNKLKTVSPESLNWLKDCDLTWLYGPLQTGPDRLLGMFSSSPVSSSHIPTFDSLQLKQTAAEIQAQECCETRRIHQTGTRRAISSRVIFPFSSRRTGTGNLSLLPSDLSSWLASPSQEEMHIHFNEQVQQCIALDMTGEEDEKIGSYTTLDDSDSSDGAIVMQSKSKLPSMGGRKVSPRTSFSADSKTIVILPSTTLKCREDMPKTTMKHSDGWWNGGKLSTTPAQETLSPSTRVSLESWEDDDTDVDRQPLSLNGDALGMFIPYEDEVAVATEGPFGKVVDAFKRENSHMDDKSEEDMVYAEARLIVGAELLRDDFDKAGARFDRREVSRDQ